MSMPAPDMPQPTVGTKPFETRTTLAMVALAMFVGGLGAWPHLQFSLTIGEPTFFFGAYDEDSYFIEFMQGMLGSYRPLSNVVFDALSFLFGHSRDAILIGADILLPMIASLAAFVLAMEIGRNWPERLLLSLLFLFGQELFSLNCQAMWPHGLDWYARLRAYLGPLNSLVPVYDTAYLNIFRTPEPQISFALLFLLLTAVIRLAAGRSEHWTVWLLFCGNALLGAGYVFLAISALLFQASAAFIFLALGRIRVAALMTAATALGSTILLMVILFNPSPAGLVFHSRLPIITPTLIGSVLAVAIFLRPLLSRYRKLPAAWLSLALMMMPMVLLNQQVVTGLMVSARDWERYANYPLFICGAALAISIVWGEKKFFRQAPLPVLVIVVGTLGLLIATAQTRSYRHFFQFNASSVAIARTLAQAENVPLTTPVVVSPLMYAPLVRIRTGDARPILLDFSRVVLAPIPRLPEDGRQPRPGPYESLLFEYFRLDGVSPDALREILMDEARAHNGFFLHFLFNIVDWWAASSDRRAVRDVSPIIPQIVERYRQYVPAAGTRLFVTNRPQHQAPGFRSSLLGQSEVAGHSAYLYAQMPQ
jgi:hypothetical protein